MSTEDFSNIWAIVPAAGIGRRMQSQVPKQYMPFLGKTLIEHTLQTLLSFTTLKGVCLALHPQDTYWEKTTLVAHPRIHCVRGGDERSDSVINALRYCCQQDGEVSSSWALVHDAARPCVSIEKIKELVASVFLKDTDIEEHVGSILAVPASDTVKRVENNRILKTEDRSTIWLAQTPQIFPSLLLRDALLECARRKITVTDEASALEALGMVVSVVEDRRDNIKVTVPEDLLWAETILANRGGMM